MPSAEGLYVEESENPVALEQLEGGDVPFDGRRRISSDRVSNLGRYLVPLIILQNIHAAIMLYCLKRYRLEIIADRDSPRSAFMKMWGESCGKGLFIKIRKGLIWSGNKLA